MSAVRGAEARLKPEGMTDLIYIEFSIMHHRQLELV